MYLIGILLAAFMILVACSDRAQDLVAADLAFTNASGLGTQNNGDFQPGSMFIWDLSSNKMQFVSTLDLEQVRAEPRPSNRNSTRIFGVGVESLPASLAGSAGTISASIGRRSSFSVTKGYRVDYRRVRSALSEYVGKLIADGDDPDLLFNPRDDNTRVVVIRSVFLAERSILRIGGTDASSPTTVASISLDSPIGDIASLRVQTISDTTCEASGNLPTANLPACFFNVVVYKPEYQSGNPKLQWQNAPYPPEQLPLAFRALR